MKVSRYVYVIASDIGITKIGIAETPNKRLQGIQADCPIPLRLFDSLKLPYSLAREVEMVCHKELAQFRTHGAWFKIDPEDAWECVQKHGHAVMHATDVDHTERRRREDYLIAMLEQENGEGLTVKVKTTDIK